MALFCKMNSKVIQKSKPYIKTRFINSGVNLRNEVMQYIRAKEVL